MTADLIAFLTACYGDEERKAKAAAELAQTAQWDTSPEGMVLDATVTDHYRRIATGENGKSLDDIGVHIATWDPKRVLAEIDAKRRILQWVQDRVHDAEDLPNDEQYQLDAAEATTLHLRWLAAPYANHSDYRPEWQPVKERTP